MFQSFWSSLSHLHSQTVESVVMGVAKRQVAPELSLVSSARQTAMFGTGHNHRCYRVSSTRPWFSSVTESSACSRLYRRRCHAGSLERIEAGEIDPSFVVTHPASLEDAPEMYKKFRDKEDGVIKVVLRPAR
jgi:threonine dehydrogenase-like Zn-dependent dehydrogenase